MDLVADFQRARWQSVVSYQGPLGTDPARPFLEDVLVRQPEMMVATEPGQSLGIRLLVFEPHDVDIEIEARLSKPEEKSATVEVSVADTPLAPLQIGPSNRKRTFTIPAKVLKKGENLLRFRSPAASLWGRFSATTGQVEPVVQDGEPARLGLPFGATVQYPVSPGAGREIWLDLSAWRQPGVAAISDGDFRLSLELESESGQSLESWQVEKFGQKSFNLKPSSEFRLLKVGLSANHSPLTGQFGVSLASPPNQPAATATVVETAAATAAPDSRLQKRPNVILFVIDTLRPDYLGCYGYSRSASPHLDQFARDAIRFEQCMSTSPWTKPSVASLLTGLSPEEHGVIDFGSKLPEDVLTLSEALGSAGYRSLAVWNNSLLGPPFAFTRGYTKKRVFGQKIPGTKVVSQALAAMEKWGANTPFFLHLHLLDTHEPYLPSPQATVLMRKAYDLDPDSGWGAHGLSTDGMNDTLHTYCVSTLSPPMPPEKKRTLEALYAAGVLDADRAFGELISWLKAHDLYDTSLIVVTADHGEELTDHGYLGHVTSLYPELIHVPLLVKLPGNAQAGSTIAGPVSLLAVGPTILHQATGASPLPGPPLPLESTKHAETEKPIFFSVEAGRQARLASQASANYLVKAEGVRLGPFVYQRASSALRPLPAEALFDLRDDPQESNNRLWDQPARALFLRSLLSGRPQGRQAQADLSPREQRELDETLRSLQYLR